MHQGPWRLLTDLPAAGSWNMAADEAMLEALCVGAAPATLRFYDWEPVCLSFGRNQPIPPEVIERCHRSGTDWVRRPTGGRAVLHAGEVTYSVAIPTEGRGVVASYRVLNEALIRGLSRLGVEAGLIRTDVAPGLAGSPSCFAAPGRADLAVEGRKVVGSAQVRRGSFLLQHGSIRLFRGPRTLGALLGTDEPEAEVLFPEAPDEDREALKQRLRGFLAEALGCPWLPGQRTPFELDRIESLRAVNRTLPANRDLPANRTPSGPGGAADEADQFPDVRRKRAETMPS